MNPFRDVWEQLDAEWKRRQATTVEGYENTKTKRRNQDPVLRDQRGPAHALPTVGLVIGGLLLAYLLSFALFCQRRAAT